MHTNYRISIIISILVLCVLSVVSCDDSTKPPQEAPPQPAPQDHFVISGTTLVSYTGTDALVRVPKGITRIGDRAFRHMGTVTGVELPDTVEHIGRQAFAWSGISEIIIPASVKTIEEWAFQSCSGLERVVFSEESKLTTFGDSAWVGCRSLTTVTLPPKLEALPAQAFMDCTALRTIELPESLHTIGMEAFRDTGLERLTLPSNIQKIEPRAFYYAKALRSVTLSATPVNPSWKTLDDAENGMGSYVFEGCDELESFEVPARCKYLKGWTFIGMNGLKTLKLHKGVRRYGEFLAQGDRGLQVVVQNADPTDTVVAPLVFPNAKPGSLNIQVPAESLAAYRNSDAWRSYTNYIEAAQEN